MSYHESPPEPSRAEVEKVLEDLAEGRCSKEQAADWAVRWVIADNPDVEDEAIWAALNALASADSKIEPEVYFYSEECFRQWLEDFREAQR